MNWKSFLWKFTERKFWVAVVTGIVAFSTTYDPSAPQEAIRNLMICTLAWIGVEGLVDIAKTIDLGQAVSEVIKWALSKEQTQKISDQNRPKDSQN